MALLLILILLLPLLGGVINACWGSRLPQPLPAVIAGGAAIGSFLACLGVLPGAEEGLRTTLFTR